MIDMPAKERLIVALDLDAADQALAIVDKLGDRVDFYKVGWQLFMGGYTPFLKQLAERKKKIFLDLKMGDIPTTIEKAITNTPAEYAEFLGFMTLTGVGATIQAARTGAKQKGIDIKFLMLTALSSLDNSDAMTLYGNTLENIIELNTQNAIDSGCDGLIASGESVRQIRDKFGYDIIIVTPGIRPAGTDVDDHKRAQTPQQAIVNGADYLVVGRPIVQAADPVDAAESLIAEIQEGLNAKDFVHST